MELDDGGGDANILDFRGFDSSTDGAPAFLMNQEVAILLETIKTQREKTNTEPPRILVETLEYCRTRTGGDLGLDRVRVFCASLRQKLEELCETSDDGTEHRLHPYEVAALCNLMEPDSTTEECTELIPSLQAEGRFSNEFVEELLELIRVEKKELALD